jgi:succinyldiaminopimelate transaminase
VLDLPDFPWDSLLPARETASAHPDGIVDLAIGSPVDPTPRVIQDALAAAGDAPGYPPTAGTPAFKQAVKDWFARRHGVTVEHANVMPTIGSKELIGLMPTLLGLRPGDVVVQPTLAYPTYAAGALAVGATVVSSDEPDEWPDATRLVWLNSPGNPDGRVLDVDLLRRSVRRARDMGAVIASDECYTELNWAEGATGPTTTILDPRVIGDSRRLTLSVNSLSKSSNLAGYRAGFAAGCSDLVDELLLARKHLGLNPPAPLQAAMVAALNDDDHVDVQRELYRARRSTLLAALTAAGFRVDGSGAGLYLWATRGKDAWATVAALAGHGILVTPGTFYGPAGAQHVRIALTATDQTIAAAARRLEQLSNP